ncbi:SIMPL domain-containing protein [Candidatus Cardinium hertigii]|uniref:SIMPL domain-containing protein n=1 Tax=Candidatus Cardinium hertigii TaxID=247481 RepID=UPI003D7CAAAD
MHKNIIKAAVMLSLGFVVSSIIFVLGLYYTRSNVVASVSVKGLSEREVDANLGIWTIPFEAVDSDLEGVNRKIKKQTEILLAFLKQQGFIDKEIIHGTAEFRYLGKNEAQPVGSSIKMEIVVHTSNVFLLYETVQKSQELMKLGVCITYHRWDGPAKFIFTDLNKIKPSMIQEATINARKAAKQFTIDANVPLGRLRSASQGAFSIEDTHIPTKKRVRVVTQMQYAIQ